MKLLVAIVALAVCIGFRNVESVPAPAPVAAPAPAKVAYPWTEWLKLRPGGAALSAALAAIISTTAAPPVDSSASDDDLTTFLKRAILPIPPKKGKAKAATSVEDASTTTKPKLIEVGDFWVPPTVAPNVTDPAVIDPAYWAAKKTMFISRLFAALAKQVLNSTGLVTTTTESPNDALLKEIDSVLLSDVARAIGDEPASTATEAAAPTTAAKPVDIFASFKTALKASAKAKKKAKAKTPKPTVAAPTPAPAPAPTVPPTTPHPTLDYSLLAKALLS